MASSADYYQRCAIPKGTTRKTQKGREDRAEGEVVKMVRPQVVARDGHCRLLVVPEQFRADMFDDCSGPSEWSHYNDTHRRSKTVGQPPEQRHCVEHSMMLCRRHSQLYDQNRIRIKELTERGCNGPLRISRPERGGVFEETE